MKICTWYHGCNSLTLEILGGQSDIAFGEEEEACEEGWPLQICFVEGGSKVGKR